MEVIIILVVLVLAAGGVAVWYTNRKTGLDVNKDGNININDALAALDTTAKTVGSVADVNKDGKVNVDDAKEVVVKVKTATKKAAKKVKEEAVKVEEKVATAVNSTRKKKSSV